MASPVVPFQVPAQNSTAFDSTVESPAPQGNGEVRFLPLGGLGEIGMNCFVLEQGSQLLIVDCGASFPEDDLGADLVIPDFRFLVERASDIAGLFITHGHEDHIGAVPFLLKALPAPIPIYAPPHAAALLAQRLGYHGLDYDCIRVVETRSRYQVGPFIVEPIAVAHSIVDATALCIETCAGRIIHTGDFDLDGQQPAGHLTDSARLNQLGDEGVHLLLSDSTNVETEQREYDEGAVVDALAEAVRTAQARLVVGMFSSNAHRLLGLVRAAEKTGRKLCLLGRSLNRQFDVLSKLGYLSFKSSLLVAKEQVAELDPKEVLVIAGGSQGEGPSALRRLSLGTHPQLSLGEGDEVLLSSRIIPGNERAVFAMVNDFLRRGVTVTTRKQCPGIHTSGHASRSELLQMMQWTRPNAFLPVHGTLMHLRRHAALAKEVGISNVCVVENGQMVRVVGGQTLALGPLVPCTPVRVAVGGELMQPEVRRRRSELSRNGVLLVSLSLDEHGQLLGVPVLSALGIPAVDEDEGAMSVLLNTVRKTVRERNGERMRSLESCLRSELRGVTHQMCGVRPVVVVHLTRDGDGPAAQRTLPSAS